MSADIDLEEPTNPELLGEEADEATAAGESTEEKPAEADADKGEKKESDTEKKDPHEGYVPRSRLNEEKEKVKEADERARALETELAAERAGKAVDKPAEAKAEPTNIDELETQYIDLLSQGEDAAAAKLRTQINAELIKSASAGVETKIREEMTRRDQAEIDRRAQEALVADKAAFDEAVKQTVAAFPFLDVKSPEANKDAIDDVVSFRDYYHKKGDPLSTALIKAVNKVAPDYAKAPENVTKLVDKRQENAVKRNIEESKKQPVALVSGVGNRSAPSTVVPAKQEDYEKLPQAEREKLLA